MFDSVLIIDAVENVTMISGVVDVRLQRNFILLSYSWPSYHYCL